MHCGCSTKLAYLSFFFLGDIADSESYAGEIYDGCAETGGIHKPARNRASIKRNTVRYADSRWKITAQNKLENAKMSKGTDVCSSHNVQFHIFNEIAQNINSAIMAIVPFTFLSQRSIVLIQEEIWFEIDLFFTRSFTSK